MKTEGKNTKDGNSTTLAIASLNKSVALNVWEKFRTNPLTNLPVEQQVKLYKRRYFHLVVISLGLLFSDVTYSQYSIVSNVLCEYYNVSAIAMQWTSLCYLLGYVIPLYPTLLLIEQKGIKCTFVVGLLVVAAGLWIQGAGTQTDLFWLILFGQFVISAAQSCFINLMPQFASCWFSTEEVSTACAVGVFANLIGMAFSCIFSPMIVNHFPEIHLSLKLSYLNYALATITSVLALVTIICFEERPERPPSVAQAKIWNQQGKSEISATEKLWSDIKMLLKNTNFVVHLVSAGILVSFVCFAVIILNELLITRYPNNGQDIGIIGLVMYFAGIPGTVTIGRIIDKTHKYKEATLGNNILMFLTLCFFVGSIYINIITVYVASILFGFFMVGYINVGLELASEISYPVNEVSSSSLVLFVGSAFGIIMTYVVNWLLASYDSVISLVVLVLFCLVGVVASAFVKPDLRRIAASKNPISNRE